MILLLVHALCIMDRSQFAAAHLVATDWFLSIMQGTHTKRRIITQQIRANIGQHDQVVLAKFMGSGVLKKSETPAVLKVTPLVGAIAMEIQLVCFDALSAWSAAAFGGGNSPESISAI